MRPKFSICNELLSDFSVEVAFRMASELGYEGIEIAPFTLTDHVGKLTSNDRSTLRNLASSNGIEIVGIHWILASPRGLHLTHPDSRIRNATKKYVFELLKFTSDIGGRIVVLGSPKQRNILDGITKAEAWEFARQALRECCEEAAKLNVYICLEPLSRDQTNFINTAEEAIAMVNDVSHPNLRIILDVYSMSDEGKPPDAIIKSVGPLLAHFHANDTNGRGPGQGNADYPAIVNALGTIRYEGFASVEIFDRSEDPVKMATDSINNLKKFFR